MKIIEKLRKYYPVPSFQGKRIDQYFPITTNQINWKLIKTLRQAYNPFIMSTSIEALLCK